MPHHHEIDSFDIDVVRLPGRAEPRPLQQKIGVRESDCHPNLPFPSACVGERGRGLGGQNLLKPLTLIVTLLLLITSLAHPITSQATDSAEVATLNALHHAVIPLRDPIDLAHRLLGLKDIPLPTPPSTPYNIGDTLDFKVENTDSQSTHTVTAQLWYATAHVYMWFEVGYTPDVDIVKQAAENFESHIYPTVHQYFGSEATPGIDGDDHLYILHTHNVGSGIEGYFASSSEYPASIEPGSNEHEMFVINLDTMSKDIGSEKYNAVLAHEFQHMVHHNMGPHEDAWFNEGLSELSAHINGYLDQGYAQQFMTNPITQLNTWPLTNLSTIPHYGASYLFADYFYQRFGQEALKALESNKLTGLENVRDVLANFKPINPKADSPITLEDLFADWTAANLINDPGVGDGRYGYAEMKTKLPAPNMQELVPSDQPQASLANNWGTTYFDVAAPGNYTFSFTASPTTRVISTDPHQGKMAWWSNRGDQSDMRLTHTFDLTGVDTATLNFWLWFAIEKEWDYGYVEVSTDDGATWTALPATDSVAPGGHNNRFGPAFTGYSGSDATSNNPQWRQETVDLTPYAGKKVQVRFEYLTDDEANDEGMFIDEISIPEIQYSTDAESGDDGWKAEGWVRIQNILPQPYLVQMIDFKPGAAPQITRLIGPGDGSNGSWSVTVNQQEHVVISVAGLAEFTTQLVPFQYTFAAQK